jgi:uncharacterized protein (DUF3820 family)
MSDLIEVKNELMGVSNQDVKALSASLKALKDFVSSELREGIDNDYAVVPGTKKRSLLKPGAEKLLRLFGLSSTVDCIEKTISPEENFAMFIYKASIYHIKSGSKIAECEGICNNLEKKYKSASAMDILNTLMKMSQKRALVGAVILATGASDFFTQDEEEIEIQKTVNQRPVDDSKFKEGSQNSNDLGNYVVPVGKFKGKTFNDVGAKDLSNYLTWISSNQSNPEGKMLELLNNGRDFLRQVG